MDIIATYLAKEFLKRKLIKEDALEWCIYGIGKRLSTLITGVLLIVSGSYHFGFLQAISFAIGFVTLRKYTNGYHAETYIHCLVLSLFLQSISMVLVKFLNADFFIVIWIVSDFVILKIAPVNNSRIHLVQSEIFVLQKRLYYVLGIVNLICIVLISLPVTKELFSVLKGLTAALALDALTLVIFALKGIYRRIFYGNQHEKSDEKISQKYD